MALRNIAAGAAAGAVTSAIGGNKESKPQREWIRPWMAAPFALAHLGLQNVAFELFGKNERLHNALLAASMPTFVLGVGAGYLLDKLSKREVAEKWAMFLAVGALTVGGTWAAAASNGDGGFNGMQDGSMLSVPTGETLLALPMAAEGAVAGVLVGEAWHNDDRQPRQTQPPVAAPLPPLQRASTGHPSAAPGPVMPPRP